MYIIQPPKRLSGLGLFSSCVQLITDTTEVMNDNQRTEEIKADGRYLAEGLELSIAATGEIKYVGKGLYPAVE